MGQEKTSKKNNLILTLWWKKGETGNLFSRKTYVSYIFDIVFHLTFTATLEICAVISSFLLLEGNKTRGYEEKLEQGLGSENKSVWHHYSAWVVVEQGAGHSIVIQVGWCVYRIWMARESFPHCDLLQKYFSWGEFTRTEPLTAFSGTTGLWVN